MTLSTAGASSLRWLATGSELLLVIWAIPVAILLVGLPVAFGLRLIVDLAAKLFGR